MIDDAIIQAFKVAWEAKRKEIGRGIAPSGTKTRAGLEAAYPHIRAQIAAEILAIYPKGKRVDSYTEGKRDGIDLASQIAKNGPTK